MTGTAEGARKAAQTRSQKNSNVTNKKGGNKSRNTNMENRRDRRRKEEK